MNHLIVACIGTGTIGSSWALNFAMSGLDVFLYDVNEDALNQAKQLIIDNLSFLVSHNVITTSQRQEILERIHPTSILETAVKDAFYIQESGPENYDIKRSILSLLETYAHPDAIIASSTSGLLISEISRDAKYPMRCIGAHPYNPPHLIPIIELSFGEKTDKAFLSKAYDFLSKIGKEPVIVNKPVMGFIGNRLSFALYRELITMVTDDVCTIEDADRVVQYGLGLRWATLGPVMLYDLGGGDAGIRGMSKLDYTLNRVFKDLSTIKALPHNWYDIAEKGLIVEKEHFQDKHQKSPKVQRDEMLLALLKLNNKLVKGENQWTKSL